ncbi:hypothetical protein PHET_01504 [Paragonimus heterotremus]|uniref:Uncharacterized protein n=1 Tax=Paragonimus heterotremus TaxID=100268 RepID=A0A8J4WL88_9TREM|nr:hypothetical protein PHET_01504 [Paragonimus heterotremus]
MGKTKEQAMFLYLCETLAIVATTDVSKQPFQAAFVNVFGPCFDVYLINRAVRLNSSLQNDRLRDPVPKSRLLPNFDRSPPRPLLPLSLSVPVSMHSSLCR